MSTSDPLLDAVALTVFLRRHRLPPLDRFGQHFLVDEGVMRDIIAATETDQTVPMIEIGAGLGVLTRALARAREERGRKTGRPAAPLLAVEIDRRLAPPLRDRVREFAAVRVTQADILKNAPERLLAEANGPGGGPYDVVGNIPYNITAPILARFLTRPPRPRRMALLVDDSVAAALAAAPPDLSLRALSIQVYAFPRVVRRRIPPLAFVPPPDVHSAILTLVTYSSPRVPPAEERGFFRLARAGFAQRRKMLANALAGTFRIAPADARAWLRSAGVDPRRRAETLAIPEWRHLLARAPSALRLH